MDKRIERVAVLGAGHGGFAAAADLTARGLQVALHARKPERLTAIRDHGGIEARGVANGVFMPALLTTDVAEAVRGADLVMLVVPAVAHQYYAERLAPLLNPELPLFLNPGHSGGGLHFVHALRRAGHQAPVRTCETATLTYIARKEGPATVGIYSYVRKLGFAAFPGRNAEALYALVHQLYPETVLRSSVLETALANMNAVFHPSGMLMNAGWIESTGGDFLFYAQCMTEGVGRVVSAIDAERMAIARALGVPATTFLEAFHRAGLTTKEAMASGSVARACRESEPNRTIRSPQSLDHRYVHEDVGFGLVPFSALGRFAGVPTPSIDAHIYLLSLATGIDYATIGLSLDKLGLAGKQPEALQQFLMDGD